VLPARRTSARTVGEEKYAKRAKHLRECRLARICNHRERRDGLLLYVALCGAAIGRIEQDKEALDDRIEVRNKRFLLDALTEVDQRRCRVRVYSVDSDHERTRQGREKETDRASGASSVGMSTVKSCW
jgi:hypothetical protein